MDFDHPVAAYISSNTDQFQSDEQEISESDFSIMRSGSNRSALDLPAESDISNIAELAGHCVLLYKSEV